KPLLSDVSLGVEAGERIGVVGRNGGGTHLAPLALCVAVAPIFRVLSRGGDIMWIQVVYLYPTFMLWLVTAAAVGVAVVAARGCAAVRLRLTTPR
ncbi:hypothetical protein AB0I15_65695, partial [Nonomuraea sp. NPDC050643]